MNKLHRRDTNIMWQTIGAMFVISGICIPLEFVFGNGWVNVIQIALYAGCITGEIVRLHQIRK